MKVWIEIPPGLGLERGVARDKTRDGVDNTDTWKNIWMPVEEKYKNEQAPDQSADIIQDGTKLLV